MKEIKAMVRTERVQAVVRALEEAGVAHLLICHVHSLGTGVDPEDFRVSFEEGSTYTEKCKVEVVSGDEVVDDVVAAISAAARTGHPGDGIVIVSEVERVIKVRTGDEGALALV